MDNDMKRQRILVFQDTLRFIEENRILSAAVAESRERTALFETEEYPELPAAPHGALGAVVMSGGRSFGTAAAYRAKYPEKKIAVLNFASAIHPGGGVKRGSPAQEESLCRCSTLYPALDQQRLRERYYNKNYLARDPRYSDAVIYSPGVVICKTDDGLPQRLEERDFVTVDVLTCAAPNLRSRFWETSSTEGELPVGITGDELLDIHRSRAAHILHIAAYYGVDILILGAFGCGAFANDPNIVARAYAEAVPAYRDRFDEIVFAIHCRNGQETPNFTAFKYQLRDLL